MIDAISGNYNNLIYPPASNNFQQDIPVLFEDNAELSIFQDEEITDDTLKNDGFNVIAHRGYDVYAPENTLAAFKSAAEQGYKTIEFDVRWTKDNVPVILHDKTINRTASKSNGDSLILPRECSKLTYDELLKYDFGIKSGENYTGEKIPTFAQTVELANENDLNMYIEIKDTKDLSNEKIQQLVDELKKEDLLDKVTWISFDSNCLKKISKICPDARLGLLSKKKISKNTIKTLNDLKTDKNEVFLDIKASKVSDKGLKLLNEEGFSFEAWGVDDEKTASDFKSKGCSGITTDILG